ncbi:MAG: response regulator transcription factor [Rhodobacteraceae bacterium]|jgi:DNA-binding response OmpR family regulator|nr:response regulator transcription factor [Alphaproteobacteria bacterium]MBT8474489.1 response regulator transcription factor [Alphaproteobacteria bacterium]NNF72803.1 response regulator transcription factor [Paracoccaceae bacterium]NNK67597.1 response regulator transcription factor [Paracoccaceae bacterium]
MEQKILIVDDDRQVTAFLDRFFSKHGYVTATAASAKELYAAVEKDRFDLIVLDLILPDEDGFEAARQIRKTSETPLIMLTARDEVFDRIVGLEIGADDYVTKPYEPRELLARVRSVLRRYNGRESNAETQSGVLSFADIELDLVKNVARRKSDGDDLELTSTEFSLLRALADAGGENLTRERILSMIYGNSVQITDRAIDAHVVRLRRKLTGGDGDGSDLIKTIHGVGYKLTAAVYRD